MGILDDDIAKVFFGIIGVMQELASACPDELEDDLQTHLRLEHDLLFPRASALEEQRRSA